jgi:glutamate dehydrogenase
VKTAGGLDAVLARVPEAYQLAIFSSYLASRFVYQNGLQPSAFALIDFLQPFLDAARRK